MQEPEGIRTTLTLDADVARRLRARARKTGKSFKEVVNDALRRGLIETPPPSRSPYRIEARPMHLRDGLSVDNVWELIEQVEGRAHA